jgi:hypothetical protein
MARNFRVAQWPEGSRVEIRRYPLKAASTFEAGALVYLDTNEVIDECGADPALILGIAEEAAADVVESGYILVAIASPTAVFAATGWDGSAQDVPEQAQLMTSFGVVKNGAASRGWEVDTSDTVQTRVRVIDYDSTRGEYLVKFLSANRQNLD